MRTVFKEEPRRFCFIFIIKLNVQENWNVLFCVFHCSWFSYITSLNHQQANLYSIKITYHGLLRDLYANIDILETQSLFVMKFSPYTLKIKQITIIIIIIIIMAGSYKAHNLQKNSKRTNNKDKQITSVNPEKPDEKDEF